MIRFDKIDKFNIHFFLQMQYLRFALKRVFFRRYYVVGEENIPKKGEPLFVISNHQNGLIDPLSVLCMFPDQRLPVFIARGDIFKKDSVAKILRFFRVMPTFRTRDGGRNDILQNNVTFTIASQILQRGGTMIMYPEAQHQHGRYLSTFKKGFPRICFSAEQMADNKLNLQILPLNLHYSNYYQMGEKLVITVGKPFPISEFLELYKEEPNHAFLAMNEKARARVKELAIDIQDQELYNEYDLLRTMISTARVKKTHSANDYPHLFQEEKKVIADLDEMRQANPSKFDVVISKTKDYLLGLKSLNLRDWIVGTRNSFGEMCLRTLLGLCVLPMAIFGFINNAIPFYLSSVLIDKVKDPMLHASVRFGMGFFIFPLYYIIMLIVSSILFHNFGYGLLYVLFSFITFYFFYYTKRGLKKYINRWRYLHFLRKDFTLRKLITLKNEIIEEMG